MSHRSDISNVPYISSISPSAVSVAGSQTIVITGNSFSPTTEVDIGSLGVITGKAFAQVSTISQTLTLTVTVAAIPDPVEDVDVTCSNGGISGNSTTVYHGFAPVSISGLSLWLDADDASTISESGGAISGWTNKAPAPYSGLFDFTQASASAQPTLVASGQNSKSVVRFADTVDEYMTAAGSDALYSPAGTDDDMTLFIVCRFTTGHTRTAPYGTRVFSWSLDSNYNRSNGGVHNDYQYCSFGDREGTESGGLHVTGGKLNGSWKKENIDTGTVITETNRIYSWRNQATSFRVNGDDTHNYIQTDAPHANASVGLARQYVVLGARNIDPASGVDHGFDGDICEVITYTSNLSDSDCEAVEAYLSTKWGITLP